MAITHAMDGCGEPHRQGELRFGENALNSSAILRTDIRAQVRCLTSPTLTTYSELPGYGPRHRGSPGRRKRTCDRTIPGAAVPLLRGRGRRRRDLSAWTETCCEPARYVSQPRKPAPQLRVRGVRLVPGVGAGRVIAQPAREPAWQPEILRHRTRRDRVGRGRNCAASRRPRGTTDRARRPAATRSPGEDAGQDPCGGVRHGRAAPAQQRCRVGRVGEHPDRAGWTSPVYRRESLGVPAWRCYGQVIGSECF